MWEEISRRDVLDEASCLVVEESVPGRRAHRPAGGIEAFDIRGLEASHCDGEGCVDRFGMCV